MIPSLILAEVTETNPGLSESEPRNFISNHVRPALLAEFCVGTDDVLGLTIKVENGKAVIIKIQEHCRDEIKEKVKVGDCITNMMHHQGGRSRTERVTDRIKSLRDLNLLKEKRPPNKVLPR